MDRALKGAASEGAAVEKTFLNDLAFKPCQECGGCYKTGVCVFHDDMRHVYKSIERADSVIIASPVFFGTVTAQLKAMIDRFNCLWIAKYVLKKRILHKKSRKGYFLCASGLQARRHFVDARKVVRNLFATLDIKYAGELFCGGLEDRGAVKTDMKAMKKAFMLGKASARAI